MVGEVVGELAMAALGDESLEEIGNKVEKVTKRFSILRHVVVPLFFIGWGIYFLWFHHREKPKKDEDSTEPHHDNEGNS